MDRNVSSNSIVGIFKRIGLLKPCDSDKSVGRWSVSLSPDNPPDKVTKVLRENPSTILYDERLANLVRHEEVTSLRHSFLTNCQ